MPMVRIAVLLPLDLAQKEMLKRAGRDRCEFIYIDADVAGEERLSLLRDADVVFGEPKLEEIRQCPRLRWIQMSQAGADVYTMREEFPKKVRLTNATGCFHMVIAEYIMAVLLELCRNLKEYAVQQQKEIWQPLGQETLLYGKRILILGAGDIGTGAAKRLKAFGTYVVGMRRTDRNYPDCYDKMIIADRLEEELPKADAVIGCLPDTPATAGLLDEEHLRMMKKGAFLINAGRGSLVDTEALIKVLQEKHLGGAALDVVSQEPLPKEHPLWKMDRVILTPHIAGQSFGCSRDTKNRIVNICCQNLDRYLSGRELMNQVNFETGYVSES